MYVINRINRNGRNLRYINLSSIELLSCCKYVAKSGWSLPLHFSNQQESVYTPICCFWLITVRFVDGCIQYKRFHITNQINRNLPHILLSLSIELLWQVCCKDQPVSDGGSWDFIRNNQSFGHHKLSCYMRHTPMSVLTQS